MVFEEFATLLEQSLPDSIPDWFGVQVDALMVNCADALPAATSPEAGTTGTGVTGTEAPGTENTETGNTGTTGN